MINKILFLLSLLFCSSFVYGQEAKDTLIAVSAKWDDSFVEWSIYTADEEEEGELRLRWPQQNNWTQWDYDWNEEYGRIETRFREDFAEWQIFGQDKTLTARTRFPRDYNEWRITDNDTSVFFKTRYAGRYDEWIVASEDQGWFTIYTEYAGDSRDWIIVDELSDTVSPSLKIAMIFIAIFNGSPKF